MFPSILLWQNFEVNSWKNTCLYGINKIIKNRYHKKNQYQISLTRKSHPECRLIGPILHSVAQSRAEVNSTSRAFNRGYQSKRTFYNSILFISINFAAHSSVLVGNSIFHCHVGRLTYRGMLFFQTHVPWDGIEGFNEMIKE